MPKVAYSQQEREEIRAALVSAALELMARQGIQHTTVEQIYRAVGISRTFFYSFFPTKEDLVVETLYLQQPRVLAHARALMDDPSLSWREGVRRFLTDCCYGERTGIAVMTIQEQQALFRRLSPESCRIFREKQKKLFQGLLTCFGVPAHEETVGLFTNLSLGVMIMRRAVPLALPFLVPQALDSTLDFQINAIVDGLERLRLDPTVPQESDPSEG